MEIEPMLGLSNLFRRYLISREECNNVFIHGLVFFCASSYNPLDDVNGDKAIVWAK